jgi:glycosyltransferase involved in cell wall biosynthesis
MLQQRTIAVIVPAFNEERFIESTLTSIPEYVDHIVVVDDGSSDSTAACVQKSRDKRVVLMRHEHNRGVGAALATGYQVAFNKDADIAAVMAGDGQMDPDDLERLLQPLLLGKADYVKGNRLSHPEVRRQMPWSRWMGNLIFTVVTRWAIGAPVSDSQCGYTALSRHAAGQVPIDRLWSGYGYPNDLLGWLTLADARVHEVQVRPVYGQEVSGIGLRHVLFVIPGVLARIWLRRVGKTRRLADDASETPVLQLSQPSENAIFYR